MSKIKLTLPAGEKLTYGKLVSFEAPCACTNVDGIQINGTDYALVDALGNSFAKTPAFKEGLLVTVAIDNVNYKALLQNPSIVATAKTISETLPVSKGGTGKTSASEALAALGGVPTTRKVNGKVLSGDITLSASDVGAAPSSHTHDYAPSGHTHTPKSIGAAPEHIVSTVDPGVGSTLETGKLYVVYK